MALKPVGKSRLPLIPPEDVTRPLATPPCCENLEAAAAAAIARRRLRGTFFCRSCQFTPVFLLLATAIVPNLREVVPRHPTRDQGGGTGESPRHERCAV